MHCIRCGRAALGHANKNWCKSFFRYSTFSCYLVTFTDGDKWIVEAPTATFAAAFANGEPFDGINGPNNKAGLVKSVELVEPLEWSKEKTIGGDNVLNVTNFRQRPAGLKEIAAPQAGQP